MQPQLKNIYTGYKIMCGCECCISTKSIKYYFLTWHDCQLKQIKDQSYNAKNRRYGEIAGQNFETYKIL